MGPALGGNGRHGANRPWADAFAIAAWAAAWAALAQVAITGVDALVRERIVYASRDVVWMAPLAYLMLALPLAALVVALGRLVPRLATPTVLTALFATGTIFAALLPFEEIARPAAAVLALGVAVAVARLLSQRPTWPRQAWRQAIVIGGVLLLTGGAMRLWRVWHERRTLAALPAAPNDAPNVLLLILDTVRAASLQLYGYERATTPRLVQLADESVVFTEAFAVAPWTLPSHASMFTGQYPTSLSTDYFVPLDDKYPTLAELLAARGYATAAFVANHNYTGYDSGLARGFARYDDYRVSFRQIFNTSWPAQALTELFPSVFNPDGPRPEQPDDIATLRIPPSHWPDLKHGPEVTSSFLDWQARQSGRPFFAFLNYYDAHEPRWSPPHLRETFQAKQWRVAGYDNAILGVDETVGALVDTLRQRGALDNTIVIVTSDHGELFGEHKLWGHANNLYRHVLHVPLLMRYPRRLPQGARVTRPVSLRDLGSTILDLTGQLPATSFPGVSLVGAATGVDSVAISPVLAFANRVINLPRRFPAARGEMHSVVEDSLQYIWNAGDNGEELFNRVADPREQRNLIETPEGAGILPRFRALVRGAAQVAGRTTSQRNTP